tara:strand:+ start:123 stop:695 length:573 start_codon:yes stop_codon:yes gene_type:complete
MKLVWVERVCAVTMAICVIVITAGMRLKFSDVHTDWRATSIGLLVGMLIVAKYVFDRWIKRENLGWDVTIDFLWMGFVAATAVGLSLLLVDDTRLRIFGLFSVGFRETLAEYPISEVRKGTAWLALYFFTVYGLTAAVRRGYAAFRGSTENAQKNTSIWKKALFAIVGGFAFLSAAGAWCVYFVVNAATL